MNAPSHWFTKLLVAGTMVAASACQDAATAPASDNPGDDIAAGRSASKNVSDVKVRVEEFGNDGTVTYSVSVRSSSRSLSAFQGAVTFVPGSLDLVSHTQRPVSGGVVLVNSNDFSAGQMRFAAYTQNAFDASGDGIEVFRFTVRYSGGNPFVTGALDVINTATNLGGTPTGPLASTMLAGAMAEGGACSGTSLWGDGNADGFVNITDAQQIARFSTGLSVGNEDAVTLRGDVTADGSVNIVDAQQIARYSVGLSAAPRTNTWMC